MKSISERVELNYKSWGEGGFRQSCSNYYLDNWGCLYMLREFLCLRIFNRNGTCGNFFGFFGSLLYFRVKVEITAVEQFDSWNRVKQN